MIHSRHMLLSSPGLLVRAPSIFVIGIATILLFSMLSAGGIFSKRVCAFVQANTFFVESPMPEPIDPWFSAYDRLRTSSSSRQLTSRGIEWRVDPRPDTCALLRMETAKEIEVASAKVKDCVIAGASIDGRFVTIGSVERTAHWMLYDDRPRLLRPVPRPVVDGEWMSVDPLRSVGIYRGRIRSTRVEGVSTWFWLTDGAGATLWAGDQTKIDATGAVLPLRLFTRPDGAMLLSYRVTDDKEKHAQRLAMLFPWQLQEGWRTMSADALPSDTPWIVRQWTAQRSGWEALIEYNRPDGERATKRVSTPY